MTFGEMSRSHFLCNSCNKYQYILDRADASFTFRCTLEIIALNISEDVIKRIISSINTNLWQSGLSVKVQATEGTRCTFVYFYSPSFIFSSWIFLSVWAMRQMFHHKFVRFQSCLHSMCHWNLSFLSLFLRGNPTLLQWRSKSSTWTTCGVPYFLLFGCLFSRLCEWLHPK